ncbi:unnamed protein product [Coffea canephora]|uniref:Uncharacterized protein n=1 Tax=Coffea canephora TaxID=49390 RepID=A0A068UMF1_COFCA|nr:unnamed protein product [Coffea canephora]
MANDGCGLIHLPEHQGKFNNEYLRETEEANKFRQDCEMRRMRQACMFALGRIELDRVKNMAPDMNEFSSFSFSYFFRKSSSLLTGQPQTLETLTNAKLKDTVTRLRSTRKCCIDIILMCIVLGIAAYLCKYPLNPPFFSMFY